jgi:methyl-accepting chemotaxis protein
MKFNTLFLKIVPVFAIFVLILGCSPKLTKDDKALLESSLKAATTANDSADRAEKAAINAEEAANRAEKAASDAASSASRAESAADAADRSAQKAESIYEKSSKALK